MFVEYFSTIFRVHSLTQKEHAACIVWGATTLVVSAILKLTPEHWVSKIPITADEDHVDANDGLMNAYMSQANAKVTKKVEDAQ